MVYHLIQNCLYQLSNKNIHYHWKKIRESLSSRVRVTIQAKAEGGKTFYHRSTTKAEKEQPEIYKALGLQSQILRATKTIL